MIQSGLSQLDLPHIRSFSTWYLQSGHPFYVLISIDVVTVIKVESVFSAESFASLLRITHIQAYGAWYSQADQRHFGDRTRASCSTWSGRKTFTLSAYPNLILQSRHPSRYWPVSTLLRWSNQNRFLSQAISPLNLPDIEIYYTWYYQAFTPVATEQYRRSFGDLSRTGFATWSVRKPLTTPAHTS